MIGAKAVTYRQLRDEIKMAGLVKAKADGSDTKAFSRLLGPLFPFPKAEGLIQYGDWPSYEYVGAEKMCIRDRYRTVFMWRPSSGGARER